MSNLPVWRELSPPRFQRVSSSATYDAVIVGGGIAGMTAALLLKEAGKTVCVLERETIGAVETGNTTAHLTYVTDERLTELAKTFSEDEARLAWQAGASAIRLIEQIVERHAIDCDFHRVDGYLHAPTCCEPTDSPDSHEPLLRAECELAQKLGFEAELVDRVPRLETLGVRYAQQAQFHPLRYLYALAAAVDGDGSHIYEESAVSEIRTDPLRAVVNNHEIRGERLIIMTHVPLMGAAGWLAASLLQTKLAAYTSYAVSGKTIPGRIPAGLYWDTQDPYQYLRVLPQKNTDLLVLGGEDHKTGQSDDADKRYLNLESALLKLVPDAILEHRWCGQVIETPDGLPYIGETAPGQFSASGFAGNGMTWGTFAGMLACDYVLGRKHPLADLLTPSRMRLRGTLRYLQENLDFPYHLVRDALSPSESDSPASLAPGEAKLLNIEGQKAACFRDDDGQLHTVSATCTHMGCAVRWNGEERTWDCPCHGSRFHANGQVYTGPAETPLEPIQYSAAPAHTTQVPPLSGGKSSRIDSTPSVPKTLEEHVMKTSSWFAKMFGTSLTLDNLRTVLVQQLRDLYSAETQLLEALPKMAAAAANEDLRSAFHTHLQETRGQKNRLERAFRLLGEEPSGETCEAMQGLISEGEEIIGLEGVPEVKDAALIAAAQRVEHYEMAGYGCARTFARQLGHSDLADLLQETLDEEGNADKVLTEIAESFVNVDAAHV